ncbi:peptidyl-prolyl cis-trans isomerase B [Klebsiella pneumoniae subsp. ozaenae]|uniref:Peptidyl-prolyl cis-trans isomerase n=1 Tax=Klebsiella pneumoniae subsp. ozaenae TaxID=574 RepID=A0A378BWT2_KLEPO|nr:peptidyl-prolyl cis-trans isomerase B [Klebsiella pneumoniae subsp. ozaenae]
MVTFHTNHGDIVIKTFDDKAPETVKNFLDYCREGFYDNTIFHRVINGFMIQGGGFEPGMKQKATKSPIQNEANNGLKKHPRHAGDGPYSGAELCHRAVLHQRG